MSRMQGVNRTMTAEMIGLFGLLGLGGIIVLYQYVERRISK